MATKTADNVKSLIAAMTAFYKENQIDERFSRTAKDWNEYLNTNYSPATFTAAVNAGLLRRGRVFHNSVYSYSLIFTDKLKAICAKYTVEHYNDDVAAANADYERKLADLKENHEAYLAWILDRRNKAEATLAAATATDTATA